MCIYIYIFIYDIFSVYTYILIYTKSFYTNFNVIKKYNLFLQNVYYINSVLSYTRMHSLLIYLTNV